MTKRNDQPSTAAPATDCRRLGTRPGVPRLVGALQCLCGRDQFSAQASLAPTCSLGGSGASTTTGAGSRSSLTYSGGRLEDESVQVQVVEDVATGERLAPIIGRQRIIFHGGSWLEFRVVVDRSLEQAEDNYPLQLGGGRPHLEKGGTMSQDIEAIRAAARRRTSSPTSTRPAWPRSCTPTWSTTTPRPVLPRAWRA